MSDTSAAPPPGRKGASRRLRALRCPLSAEILVAEFAGELPPNVASAVRKHVANCVICGPRGGNAHAPDEWVLIDDLYSLSEAFVRLAIDWCGEVGTDDGN